MLYAGSASDLQSGYEHWLTLLLYTERHSGGFQVTNYLSLSLSRSPLSYINQCRSILFFFQISLRFFFFFRKENKFINCTDYPKISNSRNDTRDFSNQHFWLVFLHLPYTSCRICNNYGDHLSRFKW